MLWQGWTSLLLPSPRRWGWAEGWDRKCSTNEAESIFSEQVSFSPALVTDTTRPIWTDLREPCKPTLDVGRNVQGVWTPCGVYPGKDLGLQLLCPWI